jgi:F-type H+-transporting ATPase subunit delta
MLSSLIAERYAKALLRAAQAENALADVGLQAAALSQALSAAEASESFLADPVAQASDKLKVVEVAFDGALHPILKAFLEAVLHQKRERFLPGILAAFKAYVDEAQGRVEASFGTARILPAAERQMLEQSLSKRLGREVTLKPYTDKALLGGAVLRMGDTLFDSSLQGRLRKLGQLLAEGPPPRPKRAPSNSAEGGAKSKAEGKAAAPGKAPKKASAGKQAAKPSKSKVTKVKAKAAPAKAKPKTKDAARKAAAPKTKTAKKR